MPTEALDDWMIAVNTAPARMPISGLENEVISWMNAGSSRSWQHRCAHHVHADEQHAQSRQDRADVLDLRALDEYDQGHADKRDERRDGTDIKRDELTSDGGADVGAP